MRTIEEMTNTVLQNPNKKWNWDEFMIRVVGWKAIPQRNTLEWVRYVEKRLRLKNNINKNLKHRKDCRRLKVKPAEGIRLLVEKEVVPATLGYRLVKETNAIATTIDECNAFIWAKNTPKNDKRMAKQRRMRAIKSLPNKIRNAIEGKREQRQIKNG